MFVYFIQSGSDGPIKIGKANEPYLRIKQLQTANAYPLRLIAKIPGGHSLERHIQALFSKYKLLNEWFLPSKEVLSFVKNIDKWEPKKEEVIKVVYKNEKRNKQKNDESNLCYEATSEEQKRIMIELYKMGFYFTEIGYMYGFSKQRAHQICKDHVSKGCRPRPKMKIREAYNELTLNSKGEPQSGSLRVRDWITI